MSPGHGLLLAFDFGLKRIGVASGNQLTLTATPVTTLTARGAPPWPQIDALIAEWQPARLVVGQPGPEAHEHLLAMLKSFIEELGRRYALPIDEVDESYSSTAAEANLRAGRAKGIYNRRLTRGQIDSEAACLIAEQWMHQALEHS
jgi:putative Holliday junction resolvase